MSPPDFDDLEVTAKESAAVYETGQMRSFIRHARIPEERAAQFWMRIERAIHGFDWLPRPAARCTDSPSGCIPCSSARPCRRTDDGD